MAMFLLLDKNAGLTTVVKSKTHILIGKLLYFVIEVGRAIFGGGIGTFNVIVFTKMFGMDMITTNAVKRAVTFVPLVVAAIIFIVNDLIIWNYGIALFLGSLIGSHAGAHIAIKKGNKFAKDVLIIAAIVMGLILLFN